MTSFFAIIFEKKQQQKTNHILRISIYIITIID